MRVRACVCVALVCWEREGRFVVRNGQEPVKTQMAPEMALLSPDTLPSLQLHRFPCLSWPLGLVSHLQDPAVAEQ